MKITKVAIYSTDMILISLEVDIVIKAGIINFLHYFHFLNIMVITIIIGLVIFLSLIILVIAIAVLLRKTRKPDPPPANILEYLLQNNVFHYENDKTDFVVFELKNGTLYVTDKYVIPNVLDKPRVMTATYDLNGFTMNVGGWKLQPNQPNEWLLRLPTYDWLLELIGDNLTLTKDNIKYKLYIS